MMSRTTEWGDAANAEHQTCFGGDHVAMYCLLRQLGPGSVKRCAAKLQANICLCTVTMLMRCAQDLKDAPLLTSACGHQQYTMLHLLYPPTSLPTLSQWLRPVLSQRQECNVRLDASIAPIIHGRMAICRVVTGLDNSEELGCVTCTQSVTRPVEARQTVL